MKKLLFIGITLLIASRISAQAPDFDGYATLGFNVGYIEGKEYQGPTLGVMHSSITFSIAMFEASTTRLALIKKEGGGHKLKIPELAMVDIGFGHKIFENFYLGFSPFSINLTETSDFGLSIIGKAKLLDKLVIEGKILPVSYTKSDVPMLKNNSYLGAHYWLSEAFCIGVRYNCNDDYNTYSIMLSWDAIELDGR